MEEKGLSDILSNLMPDADEKNPKSPENQTDEQDHALVEGLETLAGRSGGELKTAVDEFLKGKGELLESTRSALAIDKKSAEKTIVEFLTEKFDLSPTLAAVIAPMLVKLIPGAAKKKRKTSTRRKKKTSASTKRKTTKKKTTTSAKKKKPTAAKKPKKKTTITAKKKTSTTKKKTKPTKKKTSTTKKAKPKTTR